MAGTILLYGGSGGIGTSICKKLKEKDYALHIVGRNSEKLANIASEFGATYTAGDVHDTSLFSKVMEEVEGDLAGLVYAVGTINLASIRRLSEQDFLEDYKVNAMGAALAIQAALPKLKKYKAGAAIVLFSSVAAVQGFTFHASVGMAKGAVSGLTLSLAAELAPKIRVNAIAPSLVQTPLAADLLANEKTAETIAATHAMKRLGESEDIAGLTAFLLSPESSWITGQILSVDGGRSTLRTAG